MQLFRRDKEANKQERDDDDKLSPALREERERLGGRLLEAGYIDDQQLDEACQEAQRQGRRLGQVLIEKKLVTASEVVHVLTASLRDSGEEGVTVDDTRPDIEPQPAIEEEVSASLEPQIEVAEAYEGEKRQVTSRLRLTAENAAEVIQPVTLTVTPPVRTSLEIEETVSPETVPEDEATEVTYRVVIRNTKRATGRNITLDLHELPEWFQVSELKIDGQMVPDPNDKLSPLQVGDIAPGESRTIVIVGIASPSPEPSKADADY